jgi:hypothetical protein
VAVRSGRLANTALALVSESIEALFSRKLELVYLRQMRALRGGRGCDLQTVTTACEDPLEIKRLRMLKGRYELSLPALDSHPMAADLGLKVNAGNKVDVMMAVEIDLAFTLQPGKTLWPPQSV